MTNSARGKKNIVAERLKVEVYALVKERPGIPTHDIHSAFGGKYSKHLLNAHLKRLSDVSVLRSELSSRGIPAKWYLGTRTLEDLKPRVLEVTPDLVFMMSQAFPGVPIPKSKSKLVHTCKDDAPSSMSKTKDEK